MSRVALFLGRAFGTILFFLPQKFREVMAWGMTFFFFDILRFRRRLILKNLQKVYKEKLAEELVSIGRESIYHICFNFLEFFLFPAINEKWIADYVTIEGQEHLDAAFEKKKGVLLMSLHLGHGDLAISMLAHRGVPIQVISKHFHIKWLNDFWFGARRRFGAEFIDPHGRNTSFDVLKALKKNHSVIFVIDQFMGPPYGLETTFFGIKTGTAYGLALFAMKTGGPVIPIFTVRGADGKNNIIIHPEIQFEDQGEKDKTLLYMTEKFNRKLESLILAYPRQWLWLHRRWKNFY